MAAATGKTRVGTAYVDIEPDFSRFQERVGKQLSKSLAPTLDKVGADLGKRLGKGIGVGVDEGVRKGGGRAAPDGILRSFKPLTKRFEVIGRDAGRALKKGLRKERVEADDFLGLNAVNEHFARMQKEFGPSRMRRLTGRLRSELRGLSKDAVAAGRGMRTAFGGFGGFNGFMARANRSFAFFRNILSTIKWPALIAGVGLFAQALSALAAGAVAATSAIGPLAGALVTLPAAALAAAQAVSTLKLATAGVGDAIKAALDVEVSGGEQAIDVMRRQEDAAEAVADSKRNLISVQRQAKIAQEDLTRAREDARRELQDMRLAADESRDSEQQSMLSLRRARQELARTLADPASSGLDIREAEMAVELARNDVQRTRIDAKRAREDYRDAQRTGVEGMDQVVSAKRAEEDATQAVADAQRDLARATRDQTDAMKEQGAAASALQEKMAQLPPAAQKFVRFIVALKPKLDVLRRTAADGFFPGAEEGLRGLMGNFREVRGVVAQTSNVIGRVVAKAGKRLGSSIWGKDLSRLGKLNTRVINRMGNAGMNLADALRHILVSAEPFLDWLSSSTEKLTEWVEGEAAAGRESGRLAAFFDRVRESMELMGPILKGVGGALLNIGEAARPLGNEILKSLGDAAEGWREWSDSTKGQNRLRTYFAESKPAIYESGRLLRDLGKTFFELGKQRGVAHLLRLVRTELLPAVKDLFGATTGWASDFLKQFGDLRREGVPTFDAFLRTLADHAGQAGVKIAKALWNAFWDASPLGKAAVGLFLMRFGFVRAVGGAVGKRLAEALGRRFLAVVGPYFAADGLFGSVVTGRMNRMRGFFRRHGGKLGAAFAVGFITLGLADASVRRDLVNFGKALGELIVKGLTEAINWGIDRINDALDKANILGKLGVDAPNLPKVDIGSMDRILRGGVTVPWADPMIVPEPKTDRAEKKLERFRQKVGREGELTRKAFGNQVKTIPNIAEAMGRGVVRQSVPRFEAMKKGGARNAGEFREKVGGHFRSLTSTTGSAMEAIVLSVKEVLEALNLPKPKGFNAKKALRGMQRLKPMPNQTPVEPIARQRGGMVPKFAFGGLAAQVPGNSTGDRHTLSLNGVPVAKVESREGIFVGNRRLMATMEQANAAVPRFQTGGLVGYATQKLRRGGLVEPQITGPEGPLRDIGRRAVKTVFDGAKELLDKQRSKTGGVGYMPGGGGSVVAQIGRILLARGFDKEAAAGIIGNALQESGWNPAAVGMGGGGLWGFTASPVSLADLQRFAERHGKPWTDVGIQTQFMLNHLSSGLKSRLNAANTAAETTALFMNEWERPYAPTANLPRRIEGALKALKVLGRLQRGMRGMQDGGLLKLAAGGPVMQRLWSGVGPAGLHSGIRNIAAFLMEKFPSLSVTSTTGGNHSATSLHYSGHAVDIAGPGMTAAAGWIKSSGLYKALAEGIHNPNLSVEGGALVSPSHWGAKTWANHRDHIHLAATQPWTASGFTGGSSGGGAAGGPAAKPKEVVPPTYKNAKTGPIKFGPMPKDLKAVAREIAKREKELKTTEAAKRHAEKKGKPAIAQALGRNVQALADRLRGLRALQTRLRLQAVRKSLSKRFRKAFGKFEGYERLIEENQRSYQVAAQFAEQVVALEPQSPELPATATDKQRDDAERAWVQQYSAYVDGPERSAFGRVLESVATWRNNVLRAEWAGFGKGRPSVNAFQTQWEGEARKARSRIEHIRTFSEKVKERIAAWRRKHGKDPFPEGLKRQIKQRDKMRKELPVLRMRDKRFSGALSRARELFYAGRKNPLEPPRAPMAGTGSWETEHLEQIQGIHIFPEQHGLLDASQLAPPRVAGRFGGIIWDVQGSIEELGLKIKQAANSLGGPPSPDNDDSERVSLLEELLRQERQRNAVDDIQGGVISQFNSEYPLPPDLPRFHTGGIVSGPSNREQVAVLRGREGVFTPEQMEALAPAGGAGAPEALVIEQLNFGADGSVTARMGGREVEAIVKRVVGEMVGTRGLASTALR